MLRSLFEAVDYQDLEKHFRGHLNTYEWLIEQGETVPQESPYLTNMYEANNRYRPELPITVSLMHPWTIYEDIYDRIADDYMYDADMLKNIANVAKYTPFKRIFYETPVTPTLRASWYTVFNKIMEM